MSSKKSVPGPSKSETRAEQTTAIATEIIDRETSARTAKTERLRAARLQRDADDRAADPKKPAKRTAAKGKD
ncbi:hypothetical protein SAMN05421853_111105 [Roseivivax halotolerans]|jgi:hypothetical protein|uniref:Uncharacterized protein n=1 Tax=Roseivivax halotolerans TaxID=93684 RepID=A0A1I5ZQB7_9RHOB|nr:hypothetical protein [Roseivivax halotolerans]SFQ58679.1 hypothetical protein SAMN05421853_111105 [Roseivivax halotolerans]